MRNSNKIEEDFVQQILTEMIVYSFRKSKNSIVRYVDEYNIKEYIQQGITDGIEDIIHRSQFEEELQQLYQDYTFNYEPWRIIIEEDDVVDLAIPDNDWLEQNGWAIGDNINEDNLIVHNEVQEIERFKNYLESKGQLITIELLAIRFYLNHLVYPYQFDYINFVRYIMGEDRIDSDDEEEDFNMD